MATTEPENLADTIRSRSQHFHFRALSFAEISGALEEICAKENLTAEPGAIAVMARAAEGSLRDGLSLLEQARAYCGSNITDAQVRELLGVVPGEILDELTGAIQERSADRVLSLVHRMLAEGQNLQHFCREAIGHFRNLLVARVCGADSELIAAPADERPGLKKAAEFFSEEDLTRFFQILLHTDDDLRRKPDARLHLEMGLLRMVNAARLAPLEELLADLEGGTPASATPARSSGASVSTLPAASGSATAPPPPITRPGPPAAFGSARSQGASAGTATARVQAAAAPRPEITAPSAIVQEEVISAPARTEAAPAPAAMPIAVASSATAADGPRKRKSNPSKARSLRRRNFWASWWDTRRAGK